MNNFYPIINIISGLSILNPLSFLINSKDRLFLSKNIQEPIPIQTPYILSSSEANYLPIRNWSFSDPEINAKSAILFDFRSGKILFENNINKKLPIASLTKLMTAVLVIENINLEDVIKIEKSAIEDSKKLGGKNDLYLGEEIKANDLLKILLIKSSNTAAFAFRDHFLKNYNIDLVNKMNIKAKELKMNDTFFTDPAGLDDQNSFSTVQDLLKLVKYSLKYRYLFDILRTPKTEIFSIDGRLKHTIFNTNKLFGIIFNIIGGKTGFTEMAGGSMILVTKSPYSGKTLENRGLGEDYLITVVLGSNDRFSETKKLIDWAEKAYIWR